MTPRIIDMRLKPFADWRPFRFLDLPRELRDRVYEFALSHGTITIRALGHIDCRTFRARYARGLHPSVCLVSRQLYEEAQGVFYATNTFSFSNYISALVFFKKRPDGFLKNVRHLELTLQESHCGLLNDVDLPDFQHRDFLQLCELIGSQCHLHGLYLDILTYVELEDDFDSNPEIVETNEIPAWVHYVLCINNLHRLHIHWVLEDTSFHVRALASAQLMRSEMIRNRGAMSSMTGIQSRRRHIQSNEWLRYTRMKSRLATLEMSITKTGKSELERMRRVLVLPYAWCKECGAFDGRPSCNCRTRMYKSPCAQCEFEINRPCCRCSRVGTIYEGDQRQLAQILQLSSDENRPEVLEEGIWNSKKWGGKALKDYLPGGVTEGDFYKAKAYAEQGFTLVPQRVTPEDDYEDSDFGDTDSLLSVHDWNEEEDDDEDD